MLTADATRPNGGPKYLYKYRSLRGSQDEMARALDMIEGKVWAAHRSTFNDPFDCAPVIATQNDPKLRRQGVSRMVDRQSAYRNRKERRAKNKAVDRLLSGQQGQAKIADALEKTYARTGVFSLSENPDNLLMWGHYGSDHTGIAVQFEFDITVVNKDIVAPVPVVYGQARPILRYPTVDDRSIIDAAFLRKADLWSYEKEHRILFRDGVGLKQISQCQGWVSGIIFGAATSDDSKSAIRAHVNGLTGKEINFYQARLSGQEYKIEVHEI